jgi:hypothetical protein
MDKLSDLDVFGLDVTSVEEIPIDEQEAKQYMVKIYERIKRLENPSTKTVEEELITTSASENSSTSIVFSDDSFILVDDIPEFFDVKDFIEIAYDGKIHIAPYFQAPTKTKQWLRVVDHHERRIESLVCKLEELGKANDLRKQFLTGSTQPREYN